MNHFIDEKTKNLIGFTYLMKQLTISSPYGKKHMKQIKPYDNLNKLNEEYRLIESFYQLIHSSFEMEKTTSLLSKLKDIEKTIDNCLNKQILDLVDLYEIKIQAILMNELISELGKYLDFSLKLNDCSKIIDILSKEKAEISYDFYLYNSYSQELKTIREEKREIERLYFKTKDPNELEMLKQKRSTLVILEEEEELKVRKQLSNKIQTEVSIMKENIRKIGHIDVLLAKAKLAFAYGGIKPIITNDILLKDMVNPFIKTHVEIEGNQYIKNTIHLNKGTTVLTGANMSGKSSVLKTVALNLVLAHLGFYVFATYAEVPLFNGIMYVTSELESNIHGLSSFGQEINKLNETIQTMKNSKCFVILDEFARSTNPNEGQKFVSAFAEFAHNYESFTLMATHYDGVVKPSMNHYQIAGLKDDIFVKEGIHSIGDIHNYMDYTLIKVSLNELVPKEAYKVSLLLQIDKDFLKYLDKNYGSDVDE